MFCGTPEQIAWRNKPVVIIQNTDKTFKVALISSRTLEVVDLTTASAVKAVFRKKDDTKLELTLGSGVAVVGSGATGQVSITLSKAQTALLKPAERGNLELTITRASKDDTVQLIGVLNVRESVVP